jgi:hypothetical protein
METTWLGGRDVALRPPLGSEKDVYQAANLGKCLDAFFNKNVDKLVEKHNHIAAK